MAGEEDRARSSWLSKPFLTRRTVVKLVGLLPALGGSPGTATGSSGAPVDPEQPPPVANSDGRGVGRLQSQSVSGDLGRHATAVALDGTTAVVGVPPAPDETGANEGRAVVLARTGRGWRRWTTLVPDGETGQFGRAVALDGNTAIVGAELGPDPARNHAGSAAVYTTNGATWTRRATLAGDSTGDVDLFGAAVAVADDTVLVGARAAESGGRSTGGAFVFTRTGDAWSRTTRLGPQSKAVDEFGRAVAIDGDTAVVGARRTPENGYSDAGVAFVYERSGGTWQKRAELTPSGRSRDDAFGMELAVDTDTIAVGAPRETNALGNNAGAVYVFARRNGRWRQQAGIRDERGTTTREFGTAIALDGDAIVAGSGFGDDPAVFTRSEGTWTRASELRTDVTRPGAVTTVARDGNRTLVGVEEAPARSDDTAGVVEVFEPR